MFASSYSISLLEKQIFIKTVYKLLNLFFIFNPPTIIRLKHNNLSFPSPIYHFQVIILSVSISINQPFGSRALEPHELFLFKHTMKISLRFLLQLDQSCIGVAIKPYQAFHKFSAHHDK